MHKLAGMLLTACLVLALTGCGSESSMAADTLMIHKNGEVVEVITEELDEDYYSEEDLKEFVLNEIAAYNRTKDADSIRIDKLTVENDVVTMKLKYKSSADYQNFTTYTLFCGTVAEAYNAGYDLNVTLQSADMETSIGRTEILEMNEKHIVIVGAMLDIRVPDTILYMSDNVLLQNKKQVTIGSEELAYIIY